METSRYPDGGQDEPMGSPASGMDTTMELDSHLWRDSQRMGSELVQGVGLEG